MPKKCAYEGCNNNVWSKGYCLWHQWVVKAPYQIPKVSKKRKSELEQYRIDAKEFLRLNRYCQARLSGCTGRSSEVHHKAGREGKMLLIKKFWLAVCHFCHDVIHHKMSMEEAVRLGLRIKQN